MQADVAHPFAAYGFGGIPSDGRLCALCHHSDHFFISFVEHSKEFDVGASVNQGSVLSPFFFSVVLNVSSEDRRSALH